MKKVLQYLVLLMAIGMAATVAYVSVSGLVKVFAGAGTAGLIFFSIIEGGKVIATSAVHTFHKKIGVLYNIILSFFIVIAMAITSLGIYGFLSSSYKETFSKLESINGQIELLEKRRDAYQSQLNLVNVEKESVTNTITELSKGLSNNVIQYKDKETGEIITTTSSATRRALEKQLTKTTERQDILNDKSDNLSDKVFEIENEISVVKLGDESTSELGPLKYLADVTGMTMDDVMKYFILLLIVIGDPMAVVMVIVFNKIIYKEEEDVVNEVVNDAVKPEPKIDNGDVVSVVQPAIPSTEVLIKGRPVSEMTKEIISEYEARLEDVERFIDEGETEDEIIEKNKVYIAPMVDEETGTFDLSGELIEVPQELSIPSPGETEDILEVKDRITRDDIKEIKEERGFTVPIPSRRKKTSSIDRIGSNKEIRDGKSDTIFFKRNKRR